MGKDASELRREIAETRDRMSETVDALGYKADVPSRVRENINQRVETVKDTISHAVGTVRDQVTAATGAASDAVSDAGSTVREQVGSLRDGASSVDVGGNAKRAVSMAAQNPIGLALAGLAVGFLAGLVVPMSDVERVQAGRLRDELQTRTETAVGEVVDAGKEIVNTAMSSAQDRGQNIAQHALHPESASTSTS